MNSSRTEEAKQVSQSIVYSIRQLFDNHRKKVSKLNQDNRERGVKPDKLQQKFISSCSQLKAPLSNLIKDVAANDKTRKQKKNSYLDKLNDILKTLEVIENKKSIALKVNAFLEDLPRQLSTLIQKVTNYQNNFIRGGFLCGTNDSKGLFEVCMNDLMERGFLLKNLHKLEWKHNDSVAETYLPVEFQEQFFSNKIQTEVERMWPAPKIMKDDSKPVPVMVPETRIEYVQVKEPDPLRDAHQLLFGFGRPQDVAIALRIYQEEAGKGNVNAMNCLGTLFEQGKVIAADPKKALSWFSKSADRGNPEGLYRLGKLLEQGKIKSKEVFKDKYPNRQAQIRGAIEHFEKAAELGHLDAITDLGYIYENGVPCEDDPEKYYIEPHLDHAEKYYSKAKKQNFPRSYNNLGAFYLNHGGYNETVEGENQRKAIKYFEKAAELGYAKAYFNLGRCYEYGQAVPKNIDKARSLYMTGAEKGDNNSKLAYVLSILKDTMHDEKRVAQSAEMLKEILVQDKDNAEARFYLGLMYERGIGLTKDPIAAFTNIELSAKSGYPPALNKLGDYYYSGYGTKKDTETAAALYQRAAEQGHLQSLVNLGILHEKGYVPDGPSAEKAYDFYQQAARGGNHNGLVNLGLMTWHKQATGNSEHFLRQAAEAGNHHAMELLGKTGMRSTKANTNTHKEKEARWMSTKTIESKAYNSTKYPSKHVYKSQLPEENKSFKKKQNDRNKGNRVAYTTFDDSL